MNRRSSAVLVTTATLLALGVTGAATAHAAGSGYRVTSPKIVGDLTGDGVSDTSFLVSKPVPRGSSCAVRITPGRAEATPTTALTVELFRTDGICPDRGAALHTTAGPRLAVASSFASYTTQVFAASGGGAARVGTFQAAPAEAMGALDVDGDGSDDIWEDGGQDNGASVWVGHDDTWTNRISAVGATRSTPSIQFANLDGGPGLDIVASYDGGDPDGSGQTSPVVVVTDGASGRSVTLLSGAVEEDTSFVDDNHDTRLDVQVHVRAEDGRTARRLVFVNRSTPARLAFTQVDRTAAG